MNEILNTDYEEINGLYNRLLDKMKQYGMSESDQQALTAIVSRLILAWYREKK